ncbi:hypothetical protein PYCC9005_002248 [Savitreella phatthalungensis]
MGLRYNSRRLLLLLLAPFVVYEYLYFSMQFPEGISVEDWMSGKTLNDAREYVTTKVKQRLNYDGEAYDAADWLPTDDALRVSYPQRDLRQFKSFPAHNLYSGDGAAFATVFTSRNSSLSDPYFAATMNQIYRLLWSPASASEQFPFVVFVPPYISRIQREMFMGAGALVREIQPLSVKPSKPTSARFRDGFTKLNLWRETGFKRLAYLDADVFPMSNIDAIFKSVTPSRCREERLGHEDMEDDVSLCDFTFASDFTSDGAMATSIMVIEPNVHMHKRLLRDMKQTALFDSTRMDNAYLEWAFGEESAYPADHLAPQYHAQSPKGDKDEKLVHLKLWRMDKLKDQVYAKNWVQGWLSMIEFFESEKYPSLRERDAAQADRAQEQLVKNSKYRNGKESSSAKLEQGSGARYDYDADPGDDRISGADIRAALRHAAQQQKNKHHAAAAALTDTSIPDDVPPVVQPGDVKVVGDDVV